MPDLPTDAAESPGDQQTGGATNAWLAVCDDLLWGFNHALSNRLAAITSITRILEYSDTGLEPLLSALSDEIVTLERTLNLLRLVPRNPHGMEEPVILSDLLPDVLRLHQVRGEVNELTFDLHFNGETQPVWLEPARLTHALLLAFGAVSRAAKAVGATSVHTHVGSTDAAVMIEIGSAAGDGRVATGEFFTDGEAEMMRMLMGESGGEFEEGNGDGGSHLVLRLPTLLAVRQRERAGGVTPEV